MEPFSGTCKHQLLFPVAQPRRRDVDVGDVVSDPHQRVLPFLKVVLLDRARVGGAVREVVVLAEVGAQVPVGCDRKW